MKNSLKCILFTPLLLVFIFCSSEPTQEEIQAQIDAAVAQAVEEALANASSVESTTTTTSSTTTTIPVSEGDSAEAETQDLPDSAVPARRIEGEVSTFGESYDQSRYSLIRGAWISTGLTRTIDATYDAFIIKVEKTSDYDLLPGPYMVKKGGNHDIWRTIHSSSLPSRFHCMAVLGSSEPKTPSCDTKFSRLST